MADLFSIADAVFFRSRCSISSGPSPRSRLRTITSGKWSRIPGFDACMFTLC